jgi:hypothetical protein
MSSLAQLAWDAPIPAGYTELTVTEDLRFVVRDDVLADPDERAEIEALIAKIRGRHE